MSMNNTKEISRPVLICGPGRTKQSFKEKVNINSIIARHRKTGMVDHLNSKTPFYGDVSNITDYKESVEKVLEANTLFKNMSSEIREKFKNDPSEMIQFLENPDNLEEAIKLKMVTKRPEEVEKKAPEAVKKAIKTDKKPLIKEPIKDE